MSTTLRTLRRTAPTAFAALLACAALSACEGHDMSSMSHDTASATQTATSAPTSASPSSSAAATETDDTAGRSADDDAQETSPRATSARSATPTRSAAASTPASTATAKAAPAGGLPTDEGDYGDELVAALEKGDEAAVGSRADATAAAELKRARVGKGLVRTACEEGTCSYANEAGDRVTITLDADKVKSGAEHAVTTAKVSSDS